MYDRLCEKMGCHIDRCVLYVFREAVYFAGPEKARSRTAEMVELVGRKSRRNVLAEDAKEGKIAGVCCLFFPASILFMTEQSISTPPESPPELPPDANEFRPSMFARTLFLISGVILPLVCFVLGYPDQPDWQSGSASAFATLYLSHTGSMPFYPLLLYNMTSMTLLVINPQRHVSKFLGSVWSLFRRDRSVGILGILRNCVQFRPVRIEPLSFMTFVSPCSALASLGRSSMVCMLPRKNRMGQLDDLIRSCCAFCVLAILYLCILRLVAVRRPGPWPVMRRCRF